MHNIMCAYVVAYYMLITDKRFMYNINRVLRVNTVVFRFNRR